MKGCSDIAEAGIIGNIGVESGGTFKGTILQNHIGEVDSYYQRYSYNLYDGVGAGICQWTYWSRKLYLKDLATRNSSEWYDLGIQLQCLWNEMNGLDGASKYFSAAQMSNLNNMTDIATATKYFMDIYERPGIPHLDSRINYAKKDGIVTFADARHITIEYDKEPGSPFVETETISLTKMRKSNQKTALNYIPIVKKGQRVKKGDPLTEGFATRDGELALGTNLVAAFMNWNGYNYEDAIVISDRLLKNDILTSIFIDKFETTTKETKNRKEETTKNLNNVTPETERNLNTDGIIKEGLYVKAGDILVGKTVPLSSQETSSPEIALLRKIFGTKAQATVDSCLTVPPFVQGTVIKTKVISKTQKKNARETRQEEEKLIVKCNKDMLTLFSTASSSLENLILNQKTKGIYMKDGSVFMRAKK